MENMSSRKTVAARLLGTTTMTRTAIAKSTAIGLRTLYRWLEEDDFRAMIDKFRKGALDKPNINTILTMLDEAEKKELMRRLSGENDGLVFPEIHLLAAYRDYFNSHV